MGKEQVTLIKSTGNIFSFRYIVTVTAILFLFVNIIIYFQFDPFDPRSIIAKVFSALFLFLFILSFPVGAFFTKKYLNKEENKKQYVIWGITGIGWFFAAILSIECIARFFPVIDTQPINPGVKHFWPDHNRAPNAIGHNDLEIPIITKKNNTATIHYSDDQFRIAVLGDSFTEGFGVSRKNLFTRHLENNLNKSGSNKKYIVFNTGHRGLNTKDELEIIKKQLIIIRPHIVILAYVLNDAELKSGGGEKLKQEGFFNAIKWMLAASLLETEGSYAFYRYFHMTILQDGEIYSENIQKLYNSDSKGWQMVQSSLAELAELQEKNNFRSIVTVLPFFHNESIKLKNINEKVIKEAQKNNLEAYDFLDQFLSKGKLSEFAFSNVDSHPNAKAHALIGKWLSEIILKRD